MRRLLLLVAAVAVVAVSVVFAVGVSGSAGSMPPRWVMTDLGTLGGRYSSGLVINKRGDVVGSSRTATGGRHVFFWRSGKMRDLGGPLQGNSGVLLNDRGQVVWNTREGGDPVVWENGRTRHLGALPGGKNSLASGINASGQIIGFSETKSGMAHAFLWDEGRMRDLGTLGGMRSVALAINDRGQIVGESDIRAKNGDGTAVRHAFLWEEGRMIDLGTLGGKRSTASAINNRKQIVGYSDIAAKDENGGPVSRSFLWERGKMSDLDLNASDINEQGQIIGGSYHEVAVLWQNGKVSRLGTLGGKWSLAWAINDQGLIVGGSGTKVGKWHAFVWEKGVMTDLGRSGPGPSLSEAVAINSKAQIVGYSRTGVSGGGNGDPPFHAVMWTLRPGT